MAFGIQFTDPWLHQNHVIALSMLPIKSGADTAGADMLRVVCKDVTGKEYTELANSTMADAAALGVARQVEHDPDVCNMHLVDKISRAMVGDLTRTRMKVVLNAFHKAAVHFLYSTRHEKLMQFGALVDGGVAAIRPKTDHNGAPLPPVLHDPP